MAGSGGTTLTSGVGTAAVYVLGVSAVSLIGPALLVGFLGGSVLFAYSYDKHRWAGDLEKENSRAAADARELRALIVPHRPPGGDGR